MTSGATTLFSPTEALRHGWQTATVNLKNLLPISAVGANLALIRSSLSHARGGGAHRGRVGLYGAALLAVALLAGCAPAVNQHVHTAGPDGIIAGFWRGLWHGIILPVTFIVSLFSDKVGIYEGYNNGGWYNLGFVLGACCFHGGAAAKGAGRARRHRRRPAAG